MKPYKSSKERWTIDDGNKIYFQERIEHHQEIINNHLVEQKESEEKRVFIIGGGSGAGKTKFIEDVLMDIIEQLGSSFHIVNPDLIKPNILDFIQWEELMSDPEISKTIDCINSSDFVHRESSDITRFMITESKKKGLSFIYDATFKNEKKYEDLIAELLEAGYQIDIFIIDVDLDVALKRVEARNQENKEQGKHVVSEDIVRESNIEVAKAFLGLKKKKMLPAYAIYDNSVQGKEHKLIAYFNEQEGENVVYPILYEKFIEKSKTF